MLHYWKDLTKLSLGTKVVNLPQGIFASLWYTLVWIVALSKFDTHMAAKLPWSWASTSQSKPLLGRTVNPTLNFLFHLLLLKEFFSPGSLDLPELQPTAFVSSYQPMFLTHEPLVDAHLQHLKSPSPCSPSQSSDWSKRSQYHIILIRMGILA